MLQIHFFLSFRDLKKLYIPLVTTIESSFEVGSNEAGLLIRLVYLGYALVRFLSEILADIFGCLALFKVFVKVKELIAPGGRSSAYVW